MRDYVSELEERIGKVLGKWKKTSRIENGRVVQLQWQFEVSHIFVDVFWHDPDERVEIECKCARLNWNNEYQGLTDSTAAKVLERITNFAKIAENPDRF